MGQKSAIAITLALLCSAASAGGAPWYKWKNRADGSIVCTQIAPGEGWFIFRGPFQESQCQPATPQ